MARYSRRRGTSGRRSYSKRRKTKSIRKIYVSRGGNKIIKMPCYAPFNIQDPKFNNPKIRIEVPCGKCAGCLQSRRDDWTDSPTKWMYQPRHTLSRLNAEEYITYGETHPNTR